MEQVKLTELAQAKLDSLVLITKLSKEELVSTAVIHLYNQIYANRLIRVEM